PGTQGSYPISPGTLQTACVRQITARRNAGAVSSARISCCGVSSLSSVAAAICTANADSYVLRRVRGRRSLPHWQIEVKPQARCGTTRPHTRAVRHGATQSPKDPKARSVAFREIVALGALH